MIDLRWNEERIRNAINPRKALLNQLKSNEDYNKLINQGGVILKFDKFTYKIDNNFGDDDYVEIAEENGSDQALTSILSKTPNIKDLEYEVIPLIGAKKAGAFLGYIYSENWPDYGIFSEFNKANYIDNCFIVALSGCEIGHEKLDIVRCLLKGRLYVPTIMLK